MPSQAISHEAWGTGVGGRNRAEGKEGGQNRGATGLGRRADQDQVDQDQVWQHWLLNLNTGPNPLSPVHMDIAGGRGLLQCKRTNVSLLRR